MKFKGSDRFADTKLYDAVFIKNRSPNDHKKFPFYDADQFLQMYCTRFSFTFRLLSGFMCNLITQKERRKLEHAFSYVSPIDRYPWIICGFVLLLWLKIHF